MKSLNFVLAYQMPLRRSDHPQLCGQRQGVTMRLRGIPKYNDAYRRNERRKDPFMPDESPSVTSQDRKGDVKDVLAFADGSSVPPNKGGKYGDNGSGSNGDDDAEGRDEDNKTSGHAAKKTVSEENAERLKQVYALPLLGGIARRWPALRHRLMANGRLPLQLAIEVCIGFTTKTLAEVQGRGERFWKEFDFYLSDMALELFGDVMLVWLLCPVAIVGQASRALPRHAGQLGNYALAERIAAFLWKSVQFGAIGFSSSMVGHGLTKWLVKIRDERGHKIGDVTLAPNVPTSLAWGSFLMANSNTRYQIVNCIEQRIFEQALKTNAALSAALTLALRLTNSYIGSSQWLPWARMWGLQ